MNKVLTVFVFLILSVSSALIGAYISKDIYLHEMGVRSEDDYLQNLSFTQLLLEYMDREEFQQARLEVLRQFNYLLVSSATKSAENYSEKNKEACLIYQHIYNYRLNNSKKYSSGDLSDGKISDLLLFWSEVDCEKGPSNL